MQNREKNFVSCVIYLQNVENRVKGFLNEICGVMEENFEKFEIICVNDGCMDATVEKVREFLQESKQSLVVSLVNLSLFKEWKTP